MLRFFPTNEADYRHYLLATAAFKLCQSAALCLDVLGFMFFLNSYRR